MYTLQQIEQHHKRAALINKISIPNKSLYAQMKKIYPHIPDDHVRYFVQVYKRNHGVRTHKKFANINIVR